MPAPVAHCEVFACFGVVFSEFAGQRAKWAAATVTAIPLIADDDLGPGAQRVQVVEAPMSIFITKASVRTVRLDRLLAGWM